MAFNGRFVLNVAAFAAKSGADYQELIALSGLPEVRLEDPGCTVSREVYNAIVDRAIEVTGDNCLGLHLGEGLGLSAAGLIGQITQTSATVKQALEYCCEFANLGCSELPMSMEKVAHYYHIRWRANELWARQSPLAYRHTVAGNMVFILRAFHTLTRREHHPVAIHLPWQVETSLAEYQRIFRTSPAFKRGEIVMVLPARLVEQPIVTADFELLRILVAHAERKSAQLEREQGFVNTVRQSVVQLIRPEFPSVDQLARYLNLSARTLQRRLRAEGYTYQQVLNELRREFALSYLRRPELSIGEVAYLLDYADTSAFSRAFKRWEGMGPQAWREEQE